MDGRTDGEVIIEAKMETKGIDKGIAAIEAKMEKLRKKAEEPYEINGAKVTGGWNLTDEEQKYYDKLQASLDKLELQKTEILMSEKQITQELSEQSTIQEQSSSNINKWVDGVMQIADDLYVVKKDTSEIGDEAKKINLNFDKVGKSMNNIVKKIVRWGLAIFGIRGAYMAIRNAINVISQGDEQLAADIQYMKNALAYTLEPVIRKIIEWIKKLMIYVAYLIRAWTGNNIFESADKSLKSANKNAQKLKKTLAGFDEMNVLSDTSSSDGSSVMPSLNAETLENFETPKWLQDIERIGKWILDNWEDVVFTLLLIKLFIDVMTGNWLGAAFDMLVLLGIGFIELRKSINDLLDQIKILWDKFIEWFKNTKFGQFIIKSWDKIKESINKGIDWIKEKFDKLPGWAKTLIRGIVNTVIMMLNGLISGINAMLFPIRLAILAIGKVLGRGWTLESVTIPKIPYMAKGAIINQPGRGVPVGGGIGGERGAEGVIPLTDSQQMALLGESIGRYVNINATIPVYVGNRQITREIRKINAEDDFAYNR